MKDAKSAAEEVIRYLIRLSFFQAMLVADLEAQFVHQAFIYLAKGFNNTW
jgi:hypothetical protein